jgi:hypothetical protein
MLAHVTDHCIKHIHAVGFLYPSLLSLCRLYMQSNNFCFVSSEQIIDTRICIFMLSPTHDRTLRLSLFDFTSLTSLPEILPMMRHTCA